VHDLSGTPSKLMVFDPGFTWIDTRDMPLSLLNIGIDRCVDLAWTSTGFHGLLIDSSTIPTNPNNDSGSNGGQLYPLVLDGGCSDAGCTIWTGPALDAGTMHGV